LWHSILNILEIKNSQHFSLPFFKDNSFADNAGLTD